MRAVFSKLLSRGRLGRRFEGVVRGSRRFSVVSGDSGTMIQLVEKLGSRREVEQYLKLYSSIDTPRFAVIKVGGGVLADELADLADSLTFLHKAGLRPIVVHGAGPQLNQELANRKIKSDYIEGLRVTSPEIIRIAQNVFESANLKLVEALEQRGTRARPILSGVFKAEIKDPKLGLVGEILNVNLAPIYSAIDAGCMPILTCLGHSEYGQALNINADIAAREVSKAVKPLKVVYISQKGGILDEKGTIIENVDLKDDYAHLLQQSWFKHGDRLKLRQIKELLDALPDTSSVAITSAKLLAKELFTHRGSGTLIRNYERIYSFGKEDFDKIDMERLLTLIESAFDGKLSSEYANYVYTNVHKIYVSELYRAAAIVLKLKNNCHEHNADSSDEAILYLDKFAVLHQFRSDGLGNRLWKRMTAENNTLVWKSRSANVFNHFYLYIFLSYIHSFFFYFQEINPWYFMKSHGNIKMNRDWIYFWLGIDDFLQIKRCVDAISKVPKHLFRRGDVDSATIFIRDDCKEYRVGLIGARGHTGSELVQLIRN